MQRMLVLLLLALVGVLLFTVEPALGFSTVDVGVNLTEVSLRFASVKTGGARPVSVNEAVAFEIGVREDLIDSQQELQVDLDFGDGSDVLTLSRNSSWNAAPVAFHTYGVSGDYEVSAILRTADPTVNFTTSQLLRVNEQRNDCLTFAVMDQKVGSTGVLPDSQVELRIGVVFHRSKGETRDSAGISSDSDPSLIAQENHAQYAPSIDFTLTRELVEMGQLPKVQIMGDPDLVGLSFVDMDVTPNHESDDGFSAWHVAKVSEDGNGWVIKLLTKRWPGTAWLKLRSWGSATINGDCGFEDSKIAVVITPLAGLANSLPSPLLKSRWPHTLRPFNTTAGLEERTLKFTSSAPCQERVAFGVVSPKTTSFEPAFLVTWDAFDSYFVVSLSENVRWGQALNSSSYTDAAEKLSVNGVPGQLVCSSGLDCTSLEVYNFVALSSTSALLVANQGIFFLDFVELLLFSTLLPKALPQEWQITSNAFCDGEFGPEAALLINEGYTQGVFLIHNRTAVFHARERPSIDGGSRGTGTIHGLERQNASEPLTGDELFMLRSKNSISSYFVSDDFVVAYLTSSVVSNRLLVLLSRTDASNAFVGIVCDDLRAAEDPECWEYKYGLRLPKPRLGFAFPAATKMHGICTHSTGLAIFAFGDALWTSFDSGISFTVQLTLAPGERVVGCPLSNSVSAGYYVLTSLNRVFFAQLHLKGAAEVVKAHGAPKQTVLSATSELLLLDIARHNSSLQLPVVQKFPVPVEDMISTYKVPISGALVPSALTGQRLPVTCAGTTGIYSRDSGSSDTADPCFAPQYEGMVLMPMGLIIQGVDLSSDKAYLSVDSGDSRWLEFMREQLDPEAHIADECKLKLSAKLHESLTPFTNSALCSKQVPLSVNASVLCEGQEARSLEAGTLVVLSPRHGGGALRSSDDSSTLENAECYFGSLRGGTIISAASKESGGIAEIEWEISAGQWHMLHSQTNKFWLEFAPCQLSTFKLIPPMPSPSVALLDRYDMFLWRTAAGNKQAARNRAIERSRSANAPGHGESDPLGDSSALWWNADNDAPAPATFVRSNPQMLVVSSLQFTSRDALGADMSYNRYQTDFVLYQRVTPAHAPITGSDENDKSFLISGNISVTKATSPVSDPSFYPSLSTVLRDEIGDSSGESTSDSEMLANDRAGEGLNGAFYFEPSGSAQGRSTILIASKGATLACPARNVETAVVRMIVSCPNYKKLEYIPSTDALFIDLPVNYRPPSIRGKGIPLTPNVYNADPKARLYMDWYKVSRDTAVFKQCAGATSKDECNCESAIASKSVSISGLDLQVSDCIIRVQSTLYSFFFVPKMFVHISRKDGSNEAYASPLKSMFRLRDLNGRTDYCTNSSRFDDTVCGETSDITEFDFDPNAYDAILFLGEGLYHFEVTIYDSISFCELKTHILLYVLEPPLSTRIESITIAVTAISIFLLGLIAYLIFFYWNRIVYDEEDADGDDF